MPDGKWRYKGGAADEGCVAKGLADPLDELLVDWRSLDALGREQARLQWLWRNGLLTARALRAGIWALDRMAQTRALAMGDRMGGVGGALSRLQAQVAVATPQPPMVRPRLLS